MNVKELIEELNKYKNKEAEVYIYDGEDINDIQLVDLDLPDRVDLNIDLDLPIRTILDDNKVEK